MVGGEVIEATINPREWLPSYAFHMLQLWRMYQGGGMGGVGHLPDVGGTMDQPVVMIEAFNLMSGIEAELREKK